MFTETARVDGRRLGRRAPKNAPALMLADILKAVPSYPAGENYLGQVNDYCLCGNDLYGDCGPVAVSNALKVVTKIGDGSEISLTEDEVFALYETQNPQWRPDVQGDPNDDGVDMQSMLETLLNVGIGGRKPFAFAKVDAADLNQVRAAIAYFGCVLFGVTLDNAQQAQTDRRLWDYEPGTGSWGGHAVVAGSYTSQPTGGDVSVVTWADVVGVTDAFMAHQLEEAWVVVWPEHLAHPAFLGGVDVQRLADAYHQLTGKTLPDLPAPAPAPAPAPTPQPVPVPSGPPPFPDAAPAVAAKVVALAHRHQMTTSQYLNWLLEGVFHLGRAGDDFIELLHDVAWADAITSP